MGTKADSVRLCPDYTEDLIVMAKMWAGRFLKEENEQVRNLRLLLALQCSVAIQSAMGMLGIEMPERM